MFISSYNHIVSEFWGVNHTSIYENSELKVFLKKEPWILLIIIIVILAWTNNITSVISKWGTFSSFSSLVILLLVLPSNFIVSTIKKFKTVPFFNSKTNTIFYLRTYILNGRLSVTVWCFFDNILKTILNIWYRTWSIR